MNKTLLFLFISYASSTIVKAQKVKNSRYEKAFFSWGWNRDNFTTSDIKFHGNDYDFKLNNVKAIDKPGKIGWYYLDPRQLSIPQYNLRVGYHFNKKYSISFGFDHMKYVVANGQTANIDGKVNISGSKFNGTYTSQPIVISNDFLKMEHTNGLNYLNLEIRRMFPIKSVQRKNFKINILTGVGAGIMYPKSDVTLMNFNRNDQWHFAGYGTAAVTGLNFRIGKLFFINAELKGGFVNMPDILTTEFEADRAKQHFGFFQKNVCFGTNIRF